MKRVIYVIVCVLVLIFTTNSTGSCVPSSGQPFIDVGLWTKQQNIIVSSRGDFVVSNESGKTLYNFSANEKVSISYTDGGIAINGKKISPPQIVVMLKDTKSDCGIDVNRRSYRGTIIIKTATRLANGLTVINSLPVESYLYGVVANEISPEWPSDAIKAQAIAARTYALYSINKHKADGYDVCTSTDCQVYGGISSESNQTTKAVNETRGMVINHNGRIIEALFHSSGGGFTENSENVWGSSVPYLRGVADYDQKSPHYKWEKEITPQEMSNILFKAGYKIGDVQAVRLSRIQKPPCNTKDRGISGRVKSLTIIGTQGSTTIPGTRFRSLFGLNSTLFDINVQLPTAKSIDVVITDTYGIQNKKKIPIKTNTDSSNNAIDGVDVRRISGISGEKIIISGAGWGHGLGLSQWGAKAMAEKAPIAGKDFYKQIIKHYYSNVEIIEAY